MQITFGRLGWSGDFLDRNAEVSGNWTSPPLSRTDRNTLWLLVGRVESTTHGCRGVQGFDLVVFVPSHGHTYVQASDTGVHAQQRCRTCLVVRLARFYQIFSKGAGSPRAKSRAHSSSTLRLPLRLDDPTEHVLSFGGRRRYVHYYTLLLVRRPKKGTMWWSPPRKLRS